MTLTPLVPGDRPRAPKTFPVAEVFGPTIQGEGSLAGSISHFVRFGGCDYACSWCDSAHAVLAEKVRSLPRLNAEDIFERIAGLAPSPWVTLSGGNPALYELAPLVGRLRAAGYLVAVETQGSIWKPWLADVDMLTVSPKPPSSGNTTPPAELGPFYYAQVRDLSRLVFKVVVFDDRDLDYAALVHQTWPRASLFISVGTYMGGLDGTYADGRLDTREHILDRYNVVAGRVLQDTRFVNVRVLPQLHVLLWGHEQGH